ncbi:hypothetical protein BHE74_00000350 [Ensete ventricosum]|uniref:Uncharacterized protein n=1 Tax=Ensete ventricosum TaxID=4639 RepID=A0A444C7Z5_ENSVE|nr:hypothetical protein B296_00004332 [Ensete ventricosum]RWV81986.1 hypothetical protein GW17_00056551 [Ensete ventricosum]RWW90618.1 hypothetical protein BHE74_00000350 [Ensete ventricosum]RZR76308.1 hypothetical protein BHM03_00000979 [Ensete ventricosum]
MDGGRVDGEQLTYLTQNREQHFPPSLQCSTWAFIRVTWGPHVCNGHVKAFSWLGTHKDVASAFVMQGGGLQLRECQGAPWVLVNR